MPAATKAAAVPAERIAGAILVVRGHRVMLDADLASLYAVPTKALLQAVRRNAERFPEDFMFQLEPEEWELLRSQTVTSNEGRGGRRYAPFVFTEQGVAMLSTVLRSPRASPPSRRRASSRPPMKITSTRYYGGARDKVCRLALADLFLEIQQILFDTRVELLE